MQDLPNGGGGRTEGASRGLGLWSMGRGLIRGGGGVDASIGPRALETLGTPLIGGHSVDHDLHEKWNFTANNFFVGGGSPPPPKKKGLLEALMANEEYRPNVGLYKFN